MKKILAIGNALTDALVPDYSDDDLHELGLCRGGMTLINSREAAAIEGLLEGKKVFRATGGSAANTALALGRQNDAPAFIGCVGKDENGDLFASTMAKSGAAAHLLRREDCPTGTAYTFISPDKERSFATHLCAAATMRPEDVDASLMRGYNILYVEGYIAQDHELMLAILRAADEAGMEIALDMASYTVVMQERDFFRQILTDYVDIVFANREEALTYAFGGGDIDGITDPVHTAAAILGRTCRMAVVKAGEEGAVYNDNANEGRCKAVRVDNVADTTAAGSYFAAGFLHAYAQGEPAQACAERATRLAAEVTQVVGAHLTDETWKKLNNEK